MEAGSRTQVSQDTPPRGYVSLTYASSAGQKSAVLLSHGRILGLLCGSVFLSGWFVVSAVGTFTLAFSPTLRRAFFSTMIAQEKVSQAFDLDGKTPAAGAESAVIDEKDAVVPVLPLEQLPAANAKALQRMETKPRHGVLANKAVISQPAPNAHEPEVTKFDRAQIETSKGKLEFRFFLNLVQKTKKQTGLIVARAHFRTTEGKILSVASTLEGGGVFHGQDPESGIPFTMRHAVRHDLVFLAPEEIAGKFINVTARAYPDGGGAVSSVSIPAP